MGRAIYARKQQGMRTMSTQAKIAATAMALGALSLVLGYLDLALALLTTGVFLGCIEIGDK